jgi:sugar/nucleoside kinase (ribokinase family)
MKQLDVVGICNALVDILVEVDESDITRFGLKKGVMHLVEHDRQSEILGALGARPHTVELGGSAMNAIRTLAQLGKKTAFAGMIGADDFGKRIDGRMRELGIEPKLGKGREPTGSCVILITPDGERTMNTHLGVSRSYNGENVPHAEIKAARILHFSGYQWDTDGQKEAINAAIATAKEHNTLVSFDVSDPFCCVRHKDDFQRLIRDSADIVFANREEAKTLYDGTPEHAAAQIAAGGAVAVIKLGADGALAQRGSEIARIAPVPTKVVDTTAAGDMFAAGFLYGIASGKSLQVAGNMAAMMASDVIARLGAVVSADALSRVRAL